MFTLTGIHGGAQHVSKQVGSNSATLSPLQPHSEGVSLGDRTLAPPPGWQKVVLFGSPILGLLPSRSASKNPRPGSVTPVSGAWRLWRTVLSAAGQASREHWSLFTSLEVRRARGPPVQQAPGLLGSKRVPAL